MRGTRSRRGLCLAMVVTTSAILASASSALAGPPRPAWLPIAASGPTNLPPQASEIQTVAVDATSGTLTLAFEAQTHGTDRI